MYLEFFNLSSKPFSIASNPDFFYLTVSIRKAYDRIIDAIRQREPCLLLSGEPGTGKTALLNRLMADGDSRVHWIFINQTQLVWDELLVFIGQALELSEENDCSDHFSDRITEKMAELRSNGVYPVILIDEADYLESGTLKKLLQWHALNQTKGVALTIIFAGLKRLAHTLSDADHEHFATRLVGHCNLEKFDFQEMRAVIAYCLEIAEYSGPALFEDEALKLIYNLSGGIPREINLICDLGLFLAASRGQQGVTRQIIQDASMYLLLDKDASIDQDPFQEFPVNHSAPVKPTRPHPGWRVPRWRWAVAGLLIMLGGGGAWFLVRSAQIQKSLEISPPLTVMAPLNDIIEDTKKSASSPETSSRAVSGENAHLASSEPYFQNLYPEFGPSQPAMGKPQPEKKRVDLVHETPYPSRGIDQRSETRVSIPAEKEQSALMLQANEVLPLAEDMIPDPQSDPALREPVLRDDDAESRMPALFPNETHPLDDAEPLDLSDSVAHVDTLNTIDPDPADLTWPMVAQDQSDMARESSVPQEQADLLHPVDSESTDSAQPILPQGQADLELAHPTRHAQADTPNSIDSDLTDLPQPVAPQSPAVIAPEYPTLHAQILAEPPTPVPQGEELQTEPASPNLFKKEVSAVPPRHRKPDPAPKAYMAAIEPETTQISTSEQKQKEDVRAVSVPKGADLITAVENGNRQEIQQLLDKGIEVDSVSDTGETALMKAAWAGRTDIVALLLSHEPRINLQSGEGWTALFYGAVKGHKLVVASLLANEARPDLADQDGLTPLMAAAWNGHAEIVKLLLDQSVDPNRKNRDGWTSLMFSALKGHSEVARILLLHGADPAIRNNEGDTSAELASQQGNTQFLSLLSTHGHP